MNVIYHRNCLDGTFSSLMVYLLSRIVDEQELAAFQQTLLSLRHQTTSNISHPPNTHPKQYPLNPVNEEFFHGARGVPLSTYSIFAGDYYPLKFPSGSKVLFILDTTLVSAQNIAQICQSHELVVLIDHHTSFKDLQPTLDVLQLKNFVYLFDQNFCASRLTLDFVDTFFSFRSRFQHSFLSSLEQQVEFVSANDLKKNETRESKSFVLGFYYFQLEMSHLNPNLYKRVGLLDLSYLLAKGRNLYKDHLKEIREEVGRTKVLQFNMNGPFKNKRCFYLQPHNHAKISDIGTVLAYLSARDGLLNLAVLVSKKEHELRVSCRSHRSKAEPMALELSKLFNGGGHEEAAGFRLSINDFRGRFKILSAATVPTKFQLTTQQIQDIFFGPNQTQSQQQMEVQSQAMR